MATQLGNFEKVLRIGEGRRLKRLLEQAVYIATLEPEFEALSDDGLRGKTAEFRQRLENGGRDVQPLQPEVGQRTDVGGPHRQQVGFDSRGRLRPAVLEQVEVVEGG